MSDLIACVYGEAFAPFVESVVRDLQTLSKALGGELIPVQIERAVAIRARDGRARSNVRRIYVLPFDVPSQLPPDAFAGAPGLIRWLFPGAEVFNAFDVHEICWDKPGVVERWLSRGVPVPESLLTSSIEEAAGFVEKHEVAILKATRSCGGYDHYVVMAVQDGLVAEARGQRYELEFLPAGSRPRIRNRRLLYPAPFFLQRLVAAVGARRAMSPAQLLRAYIVEGQIVFWTERYRAQFRRPSDWIISTGMGGKYRFLFGVGEEARKIALRAAEAIGLRIGVVDLIRTGNEGVHVLAAYTDGPHMMIDRQFKHLPEFRDCFDLDRFITEALLAEPAPVTGIKR